MTLQEEIQQLNHEIIETMRQLQSSSQDANERLPLLFLLQELSKQREDLRAIETYYDP